MVGVGGNGVASNHGIWLVTPTTTVSGSRYSGTGVAPGSTGNLVSARDSGTHIAKAVAAY